MSGDHNMHQKPRSYLDDFECPRCGHCCKTDLARVGEVGLWGKALEKEPLYWSVTDGWVYADDTSQERVDETTKQEHEPVAWADMAVRGEDKGLSWTPGQFHKTPLYTAPPKRELTCVCGAVWEGETMVHPPREREWVGLTLREIEKCIHDANDDPIVACRNVEAKLKEKNHG